MDCISSSHLDLSNTMRMLWEQHVFWTRLLMISILDDLKDLEATQERLLRNPRDIGAVFGQFYNQNIQRIVTNLLREHLIIGAKIITAAKNNHSTEVERLNTLWYENADQMAKAFASFNPYYNENELKNMLYMHLELTTNELHLRMQGFFEKDIENFDELEQEAIEMADYFTCGIVCQFHPLLSC